LLRSSFRIPLSSLGLAVLLFLLISAAPSKPDPTEAARLNNLGCAYMNQQLFEKGLNTFQDAASLDPSLRAAKLNQGIALLALAKVDPAKALLDEAAKADPKDPHVWYALGMLGKNSANPEAAVEDFKHVIAIDDSDADTWYFLGTVYSQLKQFPQAIDAFEHALKLNPLHASAQFGLSRAYQQSGDGPHAREHLTRFQYITQNKLGSAMSLAYGEQGKYSLAEESPTAPIKVPPQIPVKFVDVTKEAGLTASASVGDAQFFHGPGACFLDYDNDGLIDVFLTDYGAQGGLSLYHNLGHGKFEDVTAKAGLDPKSRAIACTAGDYDNDGYADLALALMGRVALFHTEMNGIFKDAGEHLPIKPNGSLRTVTWIDYDHDGDLDFFLGSYAQGQYKGSPVGDELWRNNGNGTFSDVTEQTGFAGQGHHGTALGTDYNNDRAVDILVSGLDPLIFENPREGKFIARKPWDEKAIQDNTGIAVADFNHDGWMDLATTHFGEGVVALRVWYNDHGKTFRSVQLPESHVDRAYGIAAFDYDNDGWVDLVAVGETKDGKGEIKLFRNLGPDGWKDVTADVGLDKIQLKDPRAIITGDYDNDGATDLLITQNHGPAVLLKNEGGNKNNWLRLALKGLNDNKSAIGTKVEVFSDGIRQKYEIYGSNGYLGQNSPYLTVGLGQAKQADVVRMLWPGGVLQDEIEAAANKQAEFTELDRRGSSCPTLFVWNGDHYELVADVLGAGVIGHWVAPGERNIPRPVEWVKIDRNVIQGIRDSRPSQAWTGHPGGQDSHSVGQDATRVGHPSASDSTDDVGAGALTRPVEQSSTISASKAGRPGEGTRAYASRGDVRDGARRSILSFRLMEPMEEVVYLDAVKLLAVDHPANEEVYPNEYFASNPPYPEFKVITTRNAKPPAGAWDDKGNNLLPDLLAHKYVGNFDLLPFKGFAKPHSLILDLGEPYRGGPLHLLMHGEIEYFTATGMYAASQAGIEATAPYVEAEVGHVGRTFLSYQERPAQNRSDKNVRATQEGKWVRVLDDMGFPAGLPKTITVDLSGKVPIGSRRIRITTNLQIYWDSILIDRSQQTQNFKLSEIPLTKASLEFHGYPRQIEDLPPGNVEYVYEQVSRTGPYARQAGEYTRYGDVKPLLNTFDDKLAVFGSGEEVQLEFDQSKLPPPPKGWIRDYFFQANGYEKDMDFYAAEGNTVEPLPFRGMGKYPYPGKSFPNDPEHLDYMLKYNTRFVSGNEPRGYAYEFRNGAKR
jgi:tetratricopeptide (TPR) repeat protein